MLNYPEDWKQKPLGKCVDIYQGGTPKTSTASFWGGKIVWLTPGEITKIEGLYVDNSERKITEQGLNNSSACLLPEGAILLCTRATIGDLAIAKVPLATNQGFKNLVCHGDIDNVFLSYLLRTKKEEMIGRAIGTTFLEISKKELSKIIIAFPEFQEQRAIAEALTSVDTHIANLTELIGKKKAIRDGALEDLVSGRVRLEGFSGKWVIYPFEEYFRLLKNNTLPREKLSDNGSIGNIHYGDILIKYGDIVHQSSGVPRIKEGVSWSIATLLKKNDVLIADAAEDETVGKVVQIGDFDIPLVAGLHTIPCRPLIETSAGYLGFYMNSSAYHNQLLPYITGIKVSSVSRKSLKETVICIPEDVEEQCAIVEILTSMDDEISSLEDERDKMRQIKAGMMDDLLTGRVRLIG